MNSDLFNVAIIVLVVLAQLAGAIFTAWKKRQAAQEAASRQGGLVIVSEQSNAPSAPSQRTGTTSWDSDEEDDFPDDARSTENDEETAEDSWEEHSPEVFDQPPHSTTTPVSETRIERSRFDTFEQAIASETAIAPILGHPQVPAIIMRKGPSKARTALGGGNLRRGIVAQMILAPSPLARRIRR